MKPSYKKNIFVTMMICICYFALVNPVLAESSAHRETDIVFTQGDTEPTPPPKPPIKKPSVLLPQTGEKRTSYLLVTIGLMDVCLVLLVKKRIKKK